MTADTIMDMLTAHEAKFVDFRFTDTFGQFHHVTVPVANFKEDVFENGQAFDGSSFNGWKGVQASDMLLMPDPNTAFFDPFFADPTLVLVCDIADPLDGSGYDRDPRTIAHRAEMALKNTGIGETAFFGPEPEFFVFDGVKWKNSAQESSFKLYSAEGAWGSGEKSGTGAGFSGHRPGLKGGYFPVPPVDSLHDLRSDMVLTLQKVGIPVEVHHHEVATAGQCEIGTQFSTLVERADWTQLFKYVVKNVAHQYGKTATFMPKPLVGDNGSGMHVHQSIWKEGKNLFSGDGYAGLSELALFYIGGIIRHAKALNAITNPATNSYKRLVPHFEAPVKLAYSAKNRSASIRIPYTTSQKARRVEVRFPDPLANPYLAFSALLMAGLDGIQNKIHPGDAADKNLYDLPPEEEKNIPTVSSSLEESLAALANDHAFLTKNGVFSEDWISTYLELKTAEVMALKSRTHPYEFELYYSL